MTDALFAATYSAQKQSTTRLSTHVADPKLDFSLHSLIVGNRRPSLLCAWLLSHLEGIMKRLVFILSHPPTHPWRKRPLALDLSERQLLLMSTVLAVGDFSGVQIFCSQENSVGAAILSPDCSR